MIGGGSNYPLMSSTEEANAPWNKIEIEREICPTCNGYGGVWYNERGDEINPDVYSQLSEKEKNDWEFDPCEQCNGKGYIDDESNIDTDLFDEFYEWYNED